MKSVFLDTNIILDILDSARANHDNSKKLLEKTIEQDYTVVISEDMLSTVFYIVKNKKAVLGFFQLILKQWTIAPFGTDVITDAIEFCLQNKDKDFEDVLQCHCAKKSACDYLISHDKQFIDCGIKVLTINDFLNLNN